MDDFRIGYEEKTGICHISGAHRFSEEEIGAFLNHFEKKHNCSIPHKDLMLKLAGNQLLSSAEEDDIKTTVGTDVFQQFVEYINTFRARKYEHSMRPGCLIIAEKLRKIAAKITHKPCNQHDIEKLLAPVWRVKMTKLDAPRPIKIADIPKAIEENNLNNHKKAEYAVFKKIETWRRIDNFEIKYNNTTGRLLFSSHEKDWYIMVDGTEPEKIEIEKVGNGRNNYILTCKDGNQHVFYTAACECGSELKSKFISGEAA